MFFTAVRVRGFSEEIYYYSSDIRYLASGPHLITSGVVVTLHSGDSPLYNIMCAATFRVAQFQCSIFNFTYLTSHQNTLFSAYTVRRRIIHKRHYGVWWLFGGVLISLVCRVHATRGDISGPYQIHLYFIMKLNVLSLYKRNCFRHDRGAHQNVYKAIDDCLHYNNVWIFYVKITRHWLWQLNAYV